MSSRPAPQDSYVRLWSGENPDLHDALLDRLQSAGIPFVDRPFGADQIAPTADPLPIDARPRFGFTVSVPSRQLRQARQILESLLDQEPLTDLELPAADITLPGSQLPPAAKEEKPSVGIWTGTDRQTCKFLTASLQENEIRYECKKAASGTTIYVPPSQAPRAREIVREITEAAPPS
jgi:hypothetical protein